MNRTLFLIFFITLFLFSCNKISDREQIEKLSPKIIVSEGNKKNEYGFNKCNIELNVGSFSENVDEFYPSFMNRKELIYCDLSKKTSVASTNGVDIEELKKEIYPKKFGKLLNMSFATTNEERLWIPINRYCVFVNESFLTITKDVVDDFTSNKKDTIKDFEIIFKKSLLSIINNQKELSKTKIEKNDNLKTQNETHNKLSYGEIRGSLIYNEESAVQKLLGQADDEMNCLDYAQKVLKYKLGVVWMEKLMEYRVWIYNSPDNTGKKLLIIFHCNNIGADCQVIKLIYSEDVHDFTDLY